MAIGSLDFTPLAAVHRRGSSTEVTLRKTAEVLTCLLRPRSRSQNARNHLVHIQLQPGMTIFSNSQILQFVKHGFVDSSPSTHAFGVQIRDWEYMGEDTGDDYPVFLLYPLVPDYPLDSMLCGSAVNTQLEDRALHECWIAQAKGASGVAEAQEFSLFVLHENIAVGSATA